VTDKRVVGIFGLCWTWTIIPSVLSGVTSIIMLFYTYMSERVNTQHNVLTHSEWLSH
jgi:hypothetical protein